MKTMLTTAILAIGLFSSVGHAYPDPSKLEANFYKCIKHDESWYRRWGQYIESFDRNVAYRNCRSYDPIYADIKMAGCRMHGSFHKAGYYCVYE